MYVISGSPWEWARTSKGLLGYIDRYKQKKLGVGLGLESHSSAGQQTATRSIESSQARPSLPVTSRCEASMPRNSGNSLQGSSSRHRRSRTSRAQLIFAVSLVEHHLREGGHARRLSETVPIFLAAILEFLTRRLLELAGNEAQRRGVQRRITPELLDVAVYSNTLLSEFFQFVTISRVAPAHD
ncbi:histone H2A-Bbd type 2/3-like [Arvicanthis niloticus]|uniref:histone H2A-Bbd type 2/3-like n=1 Tax=Arvicanthis niloticus TaxID=61156 RepID=UPI00402B245B